MKRPNNYPADQIKEHSGWLVPLAAAVITAGLGGLVLAYYFAPVSPGLGVELPTPTDSPLRISLSLGDAKFRVPANYLPLASARNGGAVTEIGIAAMLPNFDGFSLGAASAFGANAADSPAVHINLRSGVTIAPEQERFRRIYAAQLDNENANEGPAGLRELTFRADSGYRGQDLFSGMGENGLTTILCDKPGPDTPSPNCFRDYPLPNGLALNYRFKRSHLALWAGIDKGVRALIAGFEDKGEAEVETFPPPAQ
jgi:hypothetical protein